MKIPQSVRVLYQDLLPKYQQLRTAVDSIVQSRKQPRWHYESRVKSEESLTLKLETGRVRDPRAPEDFFACTLVVENHGRIADGETFILNLFKLQQRRPKQADFTHLAPYSFDFDDLRLYVSWVDDPAQKPTGLNGTLFEVQIKTFLQHAWGIATHDFVYKADDVDWPMSRIAYQVKAMLENAELSIGEAKKLTNSAMLSRIDNECSNLRLIIQKIKERWSAEQLPKDLRRLALNIDQITNVLRVSLDEVWSALDDATACGEGASTLNLSPYGAILSALIRKKGTGLFTPLADPRSRRALFVPLEIELPIVPKEVHKRIIRPPSIT